MSTGRTHLLGNKNFNILSNGNGKSYSILLLQMVDKLLLSHLYESRQAEPTKDLPEGQAFRPYSMGRQASLFQNRAMAGHLAGSKQS